MAAMLKLSIKIFWNSQIQLLKNMSLNLSKDSFIIVTGGAGFIGSNLIEYLNEIGISNIIIVDNFSQN